ncbi:MAG TPA: non-ribosomal peptide synthetase, partial [Bryobacteraceae bacterium]
IAVRCGGRQLSFGELAERANRLAASLQTAGVNHGSIVGVGLPRSADAVVAMLAVLKCGGAYLPLDPALPGDRIGFMLAEAGVSVVVTSISESQAASNGMPLAVQSTPSDLAYVIFTSGSTGRPKGAMLPHQGVMNWMLWMRRTFEVTESDSILWKAIVGFDHSVWECFLPLICGATLVIAEAGHEADWDYLSDLIESEQVTMMQFVPSVLGRFLEQTTVEKCHSVRHVMSGGEALSPNLVHRFYEKIPGGKLCNAYGPTEASIGATMFPCPPRIDADFVPIGKPIDNVKIHILDAAMSPVKIGEAGELYIQGGLARGYVNRPELTAERFLRSPFDSQMLYRTGDLAAWLPDGNLRFIGRVDNQVKIRGLRIELEEVEAVLKRHPEIEEAAATVAGEEERASLWCYFKRTRGSSLRKEDVRAYLESRFPSYMVPSRIVEVDRFPLIDSGKIDRRGLLQIKVVEEKPGSEAADPMKAERELIVEAWRDILKVPEVGLLDDFYDLGGNSLLLTVLVVFLKKQFGMEVPPDPRMLRTVSGILDCLKAQAV